MRTHAGEDFRPRGRVLWLLGFALILLLAFRRYMREEENGMLLYGGGVAVLLLLYLLGWADSRRRGFRMLFWIAVLVTIMVSLVQLLR